VNGLCQILDALVVTSHQDTHGTAPSIKRQARRQPSAHMHQKETSSRTRNAESHCLTSQRMNLSNGSFVQRV
jgi:hypothetical protein